MEIDLIAIRTWFLSTIPGVLILGALGSVLGTALVFGLSRIRSYLASRKRHLTMSLLMPFGIRIEAARAFRGKFASKSETENYLVYAISKAVSTVMSGVALLLSFAFTSVIYVIHSIDRPILLVISIAATGYFAKETMFSLLYLESLGNESLHESETKITRELPRDVDSWLSLKDSRNDAP